MRIFTESDLFPNVQRYLPLIPVDKLYHKSYALKHPSSSFNTSFAKIEAGLHDFFTVYDLVVKEGFQSREKDQMSDVLKSYRNLLYAFREYLDDCFHVVKAFVPQSSEQKKDRDQYAWLQKNAAPLVQDFSDNISEYKKYLDLSVNELKHNGAFLGSNTFYSDHSSDHCVGYFIANVDPADDSIGPVQKIHPLFRGMQTGFSFRRDLTYNIYNVYAVSEEILAFIKEKVGIDLTALQPVITAAPEPRYKIFQSVMDMPRIHFPDEYVKPVPSLSITSDKKLKLEYPSQLTIKRNALELGVLTHSTDGHTGKFKLLYGVGK